jgi:hypothetical protein
MGGGREENAIERGTQSERIAEEQMIYIPYDLKTLIVFASLESGELVRAMGIASEAMDAREIALFDLYLRVGEQGPSERRGNQNDVTE